MEKVNENINNGLGWLEKALNIVEKYKLITIFKGIFVVLLISLTIAFLKNPTFIFERYEAWKKREHDERIELRQQNNRKLQNLTEKILYKIDADRILICETHNGLENSNGLPFSKCSATYEALNDNILPVASQYQNVNLSLMPFASYLFEHKYWCGDVEELENIDRALYHKMAGNGTNHFAAIVVEGIDNKPLAFVFISFQNIPDGHDCEEVRKIAEYTKVETAVLLELNKRGK